ncbi:MAG: exodeoxyribonuclease VII small subunit [Candidatus Hydrogenedentes bacterium]|nr:exodeoxyribonuclease VII small subunit [Candidatus Hydrogenedentota bacterium]
MAKPKRAENTFEKDLEQLEGIVAGLEEGGLPLEDSLKQFEEGIRLARQCEATLKAAEQRIETLIRNGAGELKTAPFGEEGDTAEDDTPEGEPVRKDGDDAPWEDAADDDGSLLF